MVCPNGHAVPGSIDRFCVECGEDLRPKPPDFNWCPRCETSRLHREKFCWRCGSKLEVKETK